MTWKNDQVSDKETRKIIEIAKRCLLAEGDFVELGCYKGDTSLLLAELFVENSVDNSVKKLWIYDSFEGLPEKTDKDTSEVGKDFKKGELAVTKREVKARFLRAGLVVPVIKKAWFNELVATDLPSKIAFAFLDGDLYESIRDSLRLVENRMTRGGAIMVHDYVSEALPGVAMAVDEWLERNNHKMIVFESLAIIMI